MLKNIFRLIIYLGLFYFILPSVAFSQTDEYYNSDNVILSISWRKLTPQLLDRKTCDPGKTMVVIYTEISDFFLSDGDDDYAHPVSSSSFTDNITRYVFCLSQPSQNMLVDNSSLSADDSLMAVAVFVVGNKGYDNLSKAVALVEQVEKPVDIQIASASKTKKSDAVPKIQYAEKENVTIVQPAIQSGANKVEYRIQIAASKPSDSDAKAMQRHFKLPFDVVSDTDDPKWCRFTVGSFATKEEAMKMLEEVQNTYQIKNAFIVPYVNNKRAVK